MCSFGRESYTLLKFLQCLFLFHQFGDIHAGTDIPAEVPARSITRHSLIGNPTILSIGVLQAILHNEWFARIDGGGVGLRNFRYVIRVDAFLPAFAKFLLHASPGKLKPGFVEEGAKLIFA